MEVQEVCGGNPGFLKRVALDRAKGRTVFRALRNVKKEDVYEVRRGLAPLPSDGFTKSQYVEAVRSILLAPRNVVAAMDLEAKFNESEAGESDGGQRVVQAMVKANLFAYQPDSFWARDIREDAFKVDCVVITTPSPVHLACMRDLDLLQSTIADPEETV